jgi:signal transduction histidine kinase
MNLLKKIFAELSSLEKDNKYNQLALGIVAGLGHIFFWLYWTYIDPQKYESLPLRIFGLASCIALILMTHFKPKITKFTSVYWVFSVCFNLPFFFTVNLIRNDFSEIWFVAEATMIFVVILFLTDFVRSTLVVFLGVIFAAIFCFLTAPETLYFHHNIIKNLPIYFLTFVAGNVFSFSNNKGLSVAQEVKNLQKILITKSLAGSIAHEIRNPLNAINLAANQLPIAVARVADAEVKKKHCRA